MNNAPTKIVARVERVLFPKNEDAVIEGNSAFYIVKCDIGTVKGKLSHFPKVDECLTLDGRWGVSSYNGQPEFSFFHATVYLPKDERSLLKYACAMTKGLGPALEEKIWEARGEDWRNVSEADSIKGLTSRLICELQSTIDFINLHGEQAKTISWLVGIGTTVKMAEYAFEKWQMKTIEKVKEDPYILCQLPHYGFKDIDSHIRHHFGISTNDERRINACLNYFISQATQENTVVDWNELLANVTKAIDSDPSVIADCAFKMMQNGRLVGWEKTMRIAPQRLFVAESIIWKAVTESHELPHIKAKQPRVRDFDLDEVQMDAVQYALDHSISVINGGAGCGKCLGKGTPVIMHDMTIKNVEEIRAGDVLLGPYGEPKHVLTTTAGREEMFRITPKRGGNSFTCNRSHILSVLHTRKRIKAYTDDAKKPFNISVNDILTKLNPAYRGHLKCWRAKSIERPENKVPVDPYFLGVWLGDGCSSDGCIRISNPDKEIIDWLFAYANRMGLKAKKQVSCRDHSCPLISLVSSAGRKRGGNALKKSMREMDLFNNKHIPNAYINNSEEIRLKLLAGILDTDGFYYTGVYDIVQKSKRLADDIAFLARSLGLAASVTPCRKQCCNTGVWGDYFRIIISGETDKIPCIVKRKKAKSRKQIKNPRVSGITIESIGEGDYYGFTLAEEDGLFLLGDFTVTHNTTLVKAICDSLKTTVELCAFAGKAAARLKEATCHDAGTIHRMLGFMGDDLGFTRKTLAGCTVILDEASMVSSDLMAEIVKRNPDRLILVGDEAQLPPVGSGQPFHDIIALKPEIVKTLKTCYRNKEAIFSSAINIRHGITPPPEANSERELWKIHNIKDLRATHSEVLKIVKAGEVDFDTDIILCCRNGEKGEDANTACTVLGFNRDIKDIVNPNDDGSYKIAAGDRIINTKNDAELDVWNGTTGRCREFDCDNAMWVDLDFPRSNGEKTVLIPKANVKEWQLAYALTVHKSQGSQYRKVFFVCARRDILTLLSRPMVYTAVTRAKKECHIVGDNFAFQKSIGTMQHKRTIIQELAGE